MAIDYKIGRKFRISCHSKYFELKYGNAYPVIEIEEELDFHKNFSPPSFLYLGRVLAEGKTELLQGKTYYGHIEGSVEGEFVHESELPTLVYEIKEVALKDNPFLLGLTNQGMTYQDYGPDTIIKVAARLGDYGDWTAHYLTPFTPFGDVLNYGNKLPEQAAEELFPEWAKKGLNWRS